MRWIWWGKISPSWAQWESGAELASPGEALVQLNEGKALAVPEESAFSSRTPFYWRNTDH